MAWHLFMTAQLIRSAASFCCSVQPASYSYHHQLFLLFRTNEKLWRRLCSPSSRGRSLFKHPKDLQSAYTITDHWVAFFFPLKLSLQPKWQHKRHLVYSQICSSIELYLFLGTVSSPIDPQHLLADLAHSIFGLVTEQLWSNCGA